MTRMLKPIFSVLSPGGQRGRLSILVFHRVLAQTDPLFPGEVTRHDFNAICAWLRDWFNVLPLGDAVQRLQARNLPSRALAITFDDGYADNHDEAMPILQRHGLTATFFIATGFLDGGRMWNDTVIESVRRCSRPALDLSGTVAASLGVLGLQTVQHKQSAIAAVIQATKYLPQPMRDAWVTAVAERSGAELPVDLMMSSAQVRALRRGGMGLGAHTVTHPILSQLDTPAMEAEIATGRRALQEIVGEPIGAFAYPNGRPGTDYRADAVALIQAMGFDLAVSTAWGAARAGDDVLQLPRFTPWDRTRLRFGARMARNLTLRGRASVQRPATP